MQPTVLIVDDHPSFRRFARRLLEADGFIVVGEAADGPSSLAACRAFRPDIVLLDVLLPGSDGFAVADELARAFVGQADGPTVVLTSSRDAAELAVRLARSSAHGFLAKADLTGAALAAVVADP